jgi:hypothetical protein
LLVKACLADAAWDFAGDLMNAEGGTKDAAVIARGMKIVTEIEPDFLKDGKMTGDELKLFVQAHPDKAAELAELAVSGAIQPDGWFKSNFKKAWNALAPASLRLAIDEGAITSDEFTAAVRNVHAATGVATGGGTAAAGAAVATQAAATPEPGLSKESLRRLGNYQAIVFSHIERAAGLAPGELTDALFTFMEIARREKASKEDMALMKRFAG